MPISVRQLTTPEIQFRFLSSRALNPKVDLFTHPSLNRPQTQESLTKNMRPLVALFAQLTLNTMNEGDSSMTLRRLFQCFAQSTSLAVSLLAVAVPVLGQSETATLSGTITDTSGAIISGAYVSLTNVETGMTIPTSSNAAGLYVFSDVRPGHYRLVAEKPGFHQVILTD